MPAGRRRKPEALKALEGDRKSRLNPDAPKSPKGFGPPPDHLGEAEKAVWVQIAALLDEMKLSERADAIALEMLCCSYADFWRFRRVLAENGGQHFIGTEHTVLKKHPAIDAMNAAQKSITSILSQFGLTPSARSGLKIEEPDAEEDLVALSSRGRSDA